MSIMHYNGGAVLAMVGKDCVAIGCDKRLGVQALTVSTEFPKVFKVHDRLFFGLAGLASDVATVHEHIRFKTNMYKLQENRDIEPKTLGHLISSTLYERRFGPYFIEPVIAGLDKHDKPFICSADLIGCLNFAKDFVVAGVPSANLFGMCEGLWEEGLGPDDLFETCAQALLNAVDRDALSGWGGVIHVITKEGVTTRHLKGRMD